MLHNDRETFEQVILKVASETGIEPGIIEKDYYVTLFLKRIVELQPNIIFKGGTSLSKCYKVIKRFSEDIDLNIDKELNNDLLCKTFFISRTKLYQIATNSYGKSISKYILFKRIQKAKQLLQEGTSVAHTAKKTGFIDANYFSKVFKKEVGITATSYQKKYK